MDEVGEEGKGGRERRKREEGRGRRKREEEEEPNVQLLDPPLAQMYMFLVPHFFLIILVHHAPFD